MKNKVEPALESRRERRRMPTVRTIATASASVSFSNNECLNARLVDELSVVNNSPLTQVTILQCAVSSNKCTTYTAAPIHFIFDLPLPFKVLNAQRLIATFAALPVQSAPVLPRLLSRQVQSVDYRIHALDATEDHAASLRVILENNGSSLGFSGSLCFSCSFRLSSSLGFSSSLFFSSSLCLA